MKYYFSEYAGSCHITEDGLGYITVTSDPDISGLIQTTCLGYMTSMWCQEDEPRGSLEPTGRDSPSWHMIPLSSKDMKVAFHSSVL